MHVGMVEYLTLMPFREQWRGCQVLSTCSWFTQGLCVSGAPPRFPWLFNSRLEIRTLDFASLLEILCSWVLSSFGTRGKQDSWFPSPWYLLHSTKEVKLTNASFKAEVEKLQILGGGGGRVQHAVIPKSGKKLSLPLLSVLSSNSPPFRCAPLLLSPAV